MVAGDVTAKKFFALDGNRIYSFDLP